MKLDLKSIKYEAGSEINFSRGKKYKDEGRIRLRLDEKEEIYAEDIRYKGIAKGSGENYNIEIIMDRDGSKVYDSYCSCPAYGSYDRICKHLIASFLMLLEDQEDSFPFGDSTEEILSHEEEVVDHKKSIQEDIEERLDRILNEDRDTHKEELKFEYIIQDVTDYFDDLIELKVRVGTKRLYQLKDINRFWNLKDTQGKKMYLGKEFTYDLDKHCISKEDLEMLEKISQLSSVKYDESKIKLDDSEIEFLFSEYTGRINYNKKDYMMKDIGEKSLVVEDEGKYIIDEYLPLTLKGSFLEFKNYIYRVPKEQGELYFLLYKIYKNKIKDFTDWDKIEGKMGEAIEKKGLNAICVSEEKTSPAIYVTEEDGSLEIKLKYELDKRIDGKLFRLQEDLDAVDDICSYFDEVDGMMLKKFNRNSFYNFDKQCNLLFEVIPKINEKYEVFLDKNLKKKRCKSKKIETSLSTDGKLIDFTFSIEGISKKDLEKLKKEIKEKKRYIRLTDEEIIKLEEIQLLELEGIMLELDGELSKDGITDITASKLRLLSENIEDKRKEKGKIEKYIDKLLEADKIKVPKEVRAELRDYQIKGYNWLCKLYDSNLGGILADDMGLGKTLQGIALLSRVYSQEKGQCIIVVPTSLLHNWKREFEKFAPHLDITLVEGTPGVRKAVIDEGKENTIFITSYGGLKKDIERYEEREFLVTIIDEAQHIKNSSTLVNKCVNRLKSRSKFAFTGTPIENSVYELWSIFDFVIPGYLYRKEEFKKKYGNEIMKKNNNNALQALNKITSPFILRRNKKEVLTELPDKIETDIILELHKTQKKYYLSYVEKYKKEALEYMEDGGFGKNKLKILALLTRLRQICCSPSMFIEDYKGNSSKVEGLLEILEELKSGGHRPLIFSQFTKVFPLIEEELVKRDISYQKIEGKTKSEKRQEMCEEFNNGDKDVFLISLKAGGSGLNLTGADVVIHFDPWWNPAVEDQATDRAYRMGQDKKVQVIRLVMEGTIEERILEIQKNKRKLIDSVVEGGESIEELGRGELEKLFLTI